MVTSIKELKSKKKQFVIPSYSRSCLWELLIAVLLSFKTGFLRVFVWEAGCRREWLQGGLQLYNSSLGFILQSSGVFRNIKILTYQSHLSLFLNSCEPRNQVGILIIRNFSHLKIRKLFYKFSRLSMLAKSFSSTMMPFWLITEKSERTILE